MSKISATMVADSLSPQGKRLSTFKIVFPRIILAELNTHRILSKNSASSRAIPFNKMVEVIETDPFIPIAWQKNHKGMQGTEYFTDSEDIRKNIETHLAARDFAITCATNQTNRGVTKQIANRYLEPFMWHTVLISGTEWENFFQLRCPQYVWQGNYFRSWKDLLFFVGNAEYANPSARELLTALNGMSTIERLKVNIGQAEIHMMALAECIWDAYNESKPKQLRAGEWHIPYGDQLVNNSNIAKATLEVRGNPMGITADYLGWETFRAVQIQFGTVMAARTSYTLVGEDQKPLSYQRIFAIHDDMATAVPFHASPFEHCSRAMNDEEFGSNIKGEFETIYAEKDCCCIDNSFSLPDDRFGWCRNYRGFIQYRHFIENSHLKL